MSGTIFQAFPGQSVDQNKVRPFPVTAKFVGVLNVGYYEFDSSIEIYNASSNDLCVLSGLTIGGSISAEDFNKGLDGDALSLNIVGQGSRKPVNLQPYYFNSYNQGDNFNTLWTPNATKNNKESYHMTLKGRIKQHPAIGAETSVSIQVVAMMYLAKVGFRG